MAGRRSYEHLEQESFDRPRRHTRPRTKDRPSYDDAVDGIVVTVDRGRYTCRLVSDEDVVVTAMKSRPLGRKGVVVGDNVRILPVAIAHGNLSVEVKDKEET